LVNVKKKIITKMGDIKNIIKIGSFNFETKKFYIMKLKKIKEILDADVCCGTINDSHEIMMVCASDLMSDVLTFIKPNALLLTGLTNPQVVRTADVAEVKVICFVRGKEPTEETIKLADEKGILLIKTKCSMFEACGRLYEANMVDCLKT